MRSLMFFRQYSAMVFLSLLTAPILKGQNFFWPDDKKVAIVLTYDDGITSQLETAITQLDKEEFKGTFFIDGSMSDDEIIKWRQASLNGHELGNHTIFHPCSEKTLKLHPHYLNENYDRHTIIREIDMMNSMLFAVDGKTRRTYAYPCCETVVGGKDYVDTLRTSGLVTYARVGGGKVPVTDLKSLDLFRVPSWVATDINDPEVLIEYVEKTLKSGGLGIFQFHGVGGDYLSVSAEAHQGLLNYLKEHPDVWVGTFVEVMDFVSSYQRSIK